MLIDEALAALRRRMPATAAVDLAVERGAAELIADDDEPTLSLSADIGVLGTTIVRRAREMFRADCAALYLQSGATNRIELVASDGLDTHQARAAEAAAASLAPGWVIRNQQGFISVDAHRDPRVLYLGRAPRHQSVMLAPVHVPESATVSVLTVSASRTHAFTLSQLTRLRRLADRSAVAIDHALLVAEVGARADQLAQITQAGQRIAAQLALPDVLATSVAEFATLFDVSHASLYLADAHGRVTTAAHHRGDALYPITDLAWLAERDLPTMVTDLRHSEALPDFRLALLERGVHSVLVVPVTPQQQPFGAVLLYAMGARRPFTREAQELGRIVAGQTTVAIDHAQLYHATLRAQQRSEAILQSSFTAILTADARLRVRAANDAATSLLGFTFDEMRGRPLTEILGAAAWDTAGDSLTQVRRTRRPAEPVECVIDTRGHPRRREVLLGVAPLPDGYVLSMTDITRLKEVDRLKSELVANVSHDLKGPLATIRAYTELLLEGIDDGDPGLRESFLRYIDDEVERLNGFITNILDLARIESDGYQLRRERIDLNALVTETVAAVRPSAEARAVEVVAHLPGAGGPILLMADRHLLRSLLANLLDNAVKYSQRGGRVVVTAATAPDGLCVTVQDTGVGIPADRLPHIFEKFYRAASAAESGVEGSGLGLVIARQAARAHGGHIGVTSTPGQGSTFTVHLPPTALVETRRTTPTSATTG